MSGRILAAEDKHPLAYAELDVWQTNRRGYYENQDEGQVEYNLRGRMLTDEHGKFEFQTVAPGAYEVTRGGPVGDFLKALGRHAWRPAHIHFKVTCKGYAPLTTMLFRPDDPWLGSDAIGTVKESLIAKLEKHDGPEEMRQRGVDKEFYTCRYDCVLRRAEVGG